MFRFCSVVFVMSLAAGLDPAMAQNPAPLQTVARPPRPPAPTRDPNTAGYVTAKDLPDGENVPVKVDGNFILGPTHNPAPEMTVTEGVPQGEIFNFTMESADSKFYPGIAREPNTFARPDPADPTKLLVMSHPAPYTRKVAVYVPKQYVAGTAAPFIVGADGPDKCEIAPAELQRVSAFCDDWDQASHAGDLAHAVEGGLVTRDDVTELGAVLLGDAKGRSSADEITAFDSTGLAIQDLAIALAAFEAADGLELPRIEL